MDLDIGALWRISGGRLLETACLVFDHGCFKLHGALSLNLINCARTWCLGAFTLGSVPFNTAFSFREMGERKAFTLPVPFDILTSD